jgi:hypothetical protein
MPRRILDSSLGPLPVGVERGLGDPPAVWRVTLLTNPPGLNALVAAVGASEDSAMDNLWWAIEEAAMGIPVPWQAERPGA